MTLQALEPSRHTRFREIEVRGSPREMGRQLGEAASEQVRAYADLVVERFKLGREAPISLEAALAAAAAAIPPAERYLPHAVDEVRGVAEGAGVAVEAVMLINIRNQLGAAVSPEGCTAVLVEPRASASGAGVVAQNWDNDPATDAFSVVLTRRPTGKPALMTFTRPGEVAYLGLSATGTAVALNAMPGPQRRTGVPWYFLLRAVYEAENLDAAVREVERAERAIPANALMMTADGGADIEITLDAVRVLRPDARRVLVHTNHCVHPDLVSINDRHAGEIYGQSFPRQSRAEQLLERDRRPVTLDQIKQLLSDHDGYPTSICRHPNSDPITGWQRSVVSVILEPAAGRMHLSRGNPCEKPYEIYELHA